MKIDSYIYSLRKLLNSQERTMISYAIFINRYMGSGKFYILLEYSTNFQNLLKASIGMEKKILENSRLFWKFP